jgi:hypothetical protein
VIIFIRLFTPPLGDIQILFPGQRELSGAPILLTVVASPALGVVASAHLFLETGSTVAVALIVAEAIPSCRCLVFCRLGVDRGLAHMSGGRYVMHRGAPSPSGGRALGLSGCGIIQEVLEFALDASPFGGGWLRHHSKQHRRCSQVLAGPVDGRGQHCPGIINNAALDVPGTMTRSSGERSACPLLLEVLPELHKSPRFLVELGLHLTELLKL